MKNFIFAWIISFINIHTFVCDMMMNCFCGMDNRRKALSLISRRDHRQILTIAYLQHAVSWIWTCAEPEFRLFVLKLCYKIAIIIIANISKDNKKTYFKPVMVHGSSSLVITKLCMARFTMSECLIFINFTFSITIESTYARIPYLVFLANMFFETFSTFTLSFIIVPFLSCITFCTMQFLTTVTKIIAY